MTDKKADKAPVIPKNADDLIRQDEAAKLGKHALEPTSQPEPQSEPETPPLAAESKPKSEEAPASEESEEQTAEKESQPESDKPHEPEEDKASDEASEGDEVDDYGTKVTSAKKKMYTEEEVQRMIRERLSRGKHAEQGTQQQQDIQQAAKDFTPDPESSESWETQLETFVENTIEKLSRKAQDKEWKAREEQSQAEFEVKFSEGMGKYKDFSQVVANKPITNAMMLATRSMKDPAAFLYAACKQQPKELARISQIQDPVTQAAEIGRLEERMKKARAIPQSPKPASKISGDASDALPQLDIDARIAQHAKTKVMR